MTTFAQYQERGLAYLKAQVGKPYSESPGQNFGPYSFDCMGLAYCTYKAAANLVTGPGIGLIGSRAQFELSTVKMQPSDPWLVLDQCFFDGYDPPFGHTGVYVGPVVPGGAPMMIDAYDTAEGVRYNEFDPNMTDTGSGLILRGRTRPLLLAPHLTPPEGIKMDLVLANGGAIGKILANAYWLVGCDESGPFAWHVTAAQANIWEAVHGPLKTITTSQLSSLGVNVLNAG